MSHHLTAFPERFRYRLIWIFILVVGITMITGKIAQAEGNEPTITPTATNTLVPSETPMPTESLLFESPTLPPGYTVEEKVVPQAPDTTLDEVQPKTGLFQGTNLCLIGAIVVGAIAVMVLVVFGVVQRVRA